MRGGATQWGFGRGTGGSSGLSSVVFRVWTEMPSGVIEFYVLHAEVHYCRGQHEIFYFILSPPE